jgi:hypothetical protein
MMMEHFVIPLKFVSDRDPKFMNVFWKTLCRRFWISHTTTTVYNTQANGAAERMSQTLEMILRNYMNDWQFHMVEEGEMR